MNLSSLSAVLTAAGFKNVSYSGSAVVMSCPYAAVHPHLHKHGDANPSFNIYKPDNGPVKGYCHGCHNGDELYLMLYTLQYRAKLYELDLPQYGKALGLLASADVVDYAAITCTDDAAKVFTPFPENWLKSFSTVDKTPAAVEYLNSRGVTPELAKKLELRFDNAKWMVGFPYRSVDGKLAGMRGRSIDPTAVTRHFDYKYNDCNNAGFVWFNGDKIDPSQYVVVVEGQFDLCSVLRVYPNVVALLTSTASHEKMALLANNPQGVVWLTDNDSAGISSRTKARTYFESVGTPFADAYVPTGKKDPAECSSAELEKVLADAMPQLL